MAQLEPKLKRCVKIITSTQSSSGSRKGRNSQLVSHPPTSLRSRAGQRLSVKSLAKLNRAVRGTPANDAPLNSLLILLAPFLETGLPVVGLRAEGVCDLVEHERTGLLLDMDDLLPNGPKMPTNPAAFKPLPTDPHSLVGSSSPTFPVAVELYRFLLVRSATLHDERRQMGSAAHLVASKRSWFGAMEMLVDGYREVIGKAERRSFSETPTIKFDVVTQDATTEKAEQVGPQTRRRKKLSKLRRSSRSFVTFSDDKVTQAMCGEYPARPSAGL